MKVRFCRFFTVLLISVFLCGHCLVPAEGAQGQGRLMLRTDATMVTSDVTVIGPNTTSLGMEDFVIYDNGVPFPVTHFSRNKLPLAVALLIDTSMTVQPYLPLIQVAAGAALRNLNPDDMSVLYSFAKDPKRHSKLTDDRVEIAQKISKLEFSYGTNIYETISDAAKYLQKNAPNHRRAIIMISDNYHITTPANYAARPLMPAGAGSTDQELDEKSAEDARTRALEGAVTIFSIKTPSITDMDVSGSLPRVRRIVADTGGEVQDIRGWASLQAAMEEILSTLRKQYTIGFNPTDLGEDGSFHKLEVKFADEKRCSGCRILARTGYYAGISSPTPAREDKKKKNPKYSREEADRLIIQQSIATAGIYTHLGMYGYAVEDMVNNMDESRLSDISIDAAPSRAKDSRGKDILRINLNIATDRVKFLDVDDRHGCTLHIGVFYFDKYMKLIGSGVQILEGMLKEETYRQAMASGIVYQIEIPLKVNKQYVNVVVYDENSDRAGSRFIRPLPEE